MSASSQQLLQDDKAHENKGPAILATCSSLTAVATLFVAARLYVRVSILSRVGLDDWLIVISLLCGYLMLGLTIAAVISGNGRHFASLTVEQKSGAILYTLAGFCPGIFSFGVPKLAVVALLTRITNPSRRQRIFLWSLTGGCLVVLFGCVVILFAQCTPTRSQWDFSVKGTCWSPWVLVNYAIVAGTTSAAVDLYLALYPALVLYRLRINRRKKVALSVALGLGSIAGAVAIYKSTRLPALASPDFTYDTAGITVWTSIEGNAIIIAACIPTLQPLLDRLLKRRIFGSTDNYQKQADCQGHVTPRVELATIGSRSRTNPKTKGKMGISDTTIGRDSEEEILHSEEPQRHSEDEEVGVGGESQSVAGQNGGILRTQRTTVTYEDSPLSSAGKLVKEGGASNS